MSKEKKFFRINLIKLHGKFYFKEMLSYGLFKEIIILREMLKLETLYYKFARNRKCYIYNLIKLHTILYLKVCYLVEDLKR